MILAVDVYYVEYQANAVGVLYDWLDEANVIGEILNQNAQKVGKWSMKDIMNDLHTLNNNLRDIPQWQRSFKNITAKERMELTDFDKWNLSEFLEKL